MNTLPVDVSFAVSEATQSDVVRRKLDMDALRDRLGDPRTQQEKLRETCEGFESIFLQKMWEQMRKTVSKEGYLHSKDEDTYQSLFDVELSKKMSSAGGIGLADMLYEQLSQQLEHTARTTTPGSYRQPLPMDPVNAAAIGPVQPELPNEDKKLTEKDLYSPLDDEGNEEDADNEQALADENTIFQALESIRTDLEASVEPSTVGTEIREQIAATLAPSAVPPGANAADNAEEKASGFRQTSWQGSGNVSAAPRPISTFNRGKANAPAEVEAPKQRSTLPSDTLWPYDGKIASKFGWEEDPAGGRRWNSGVTLEGKAGDPVQAILDGTVVFSGQREGYGNTVILEHANGFRSYYGNVADEGLAVGDTVRRGSNFASIGMQPSAAQAGENSAPLFFELKRGEMALNPEITIAKLTTAGR